MNRGELWRELRKYPSAIAGLLIILGLVALSVYTVIALPYEQAVTLWRGGENLWTENPRNAAPRWLNLLPGPKRSETLKLDSAAGAGHKEVEAYAEDFKEVRIDLPVPFEYDTFPKELTVFISATYASKRPHVSFTWVTPDGREIDLGERTLRDKADTYRVSQDTRLQSRLRGQPAHIGLFADPAAPTPTPLKGIHHLVIEGLLFESASDLDVKLIVYGELYGWAGTDERRRDLAVALLWGAPIALSFGLLAAVGATGATMVIAATSAWYSDSLPSHQWIRSGCVSAATSDTHWSSAARRLPCAGITCGRGTAFIDVLPGKANGIAAENSRKREVYRCKRDVACSRATCEMRWKRFHADGQRCHVTAVGRSCLPRATRSRQPGTSVLVRWST